MRKITSKRTLIMVLFLLISASFSYALTEEEIKGLEGTALPGRLGILFGNVNINVHVLMSGGEETVYGLVTKDQKVQSIVLGGVEKPALNAYVDEATVQAIETAKNPLPVLLKALKEKKIRYKAVGLVNKIKYAFLSVYSNAAGLFAPKLEADVDEKEGKSPTEPQEEKKEKSPIEPEEKDKEDRGEEEPQRSPEPQEQNESEEKKDETGLITGGAVGELKEGETHFVELTDSGFEPDMLTVKAGDTVVWQNVRTGNINRALVIGVRECAKMRSKLFTPGESFSWTFDEPMKCTVVDGIVTTIASEVVVE